MRQLTLSLRSTNIFNSHFHITTPTFDIFTHISGAILCPVEHENAKSYKHLSSLRLISLDLGSGSGPAPNSVRCMQIACESLSLSLGGA